MKKNIALAALAIAMAQMVGAQDTYESARLLGSDLNGTARYVGMGGAMEALGADISTIGTNPAGIGLFRHSQANLSFGAVSQQDATKFDGLGKTNMSFDQAGFVYSNRVSQKSFINFAFNYHKSRNFDQIINVADQKLKNASLNDLTAQKYRDYKFDPYIDKDGSFLGIWSDGDRAYSYNQIDDLNANGLYMYEEYTDSKGELYQELYANYGDWYNFDRAHRGWISNFDFNLSGNHNDRFYWGITLGLKDLNYKGYSEYAERLNRLDDAGREQDAGVVAYGDERRIKGTGLDITAGVIFRPVEESPFRLGLSIATPTWYDLTSENNTMLVNNTVYRQNEGGDVFSVSESYDFKYYTPWKFGLSAGHTVGTNLAIGASYEYSDYGASKNRINDGIDWDGYEHSSTDEVMKAHTERTLKGVHTLKLGGEYKPVPEMSVRLGYNYVSAAYDENAYRDMSIESVGAMYASTADYTNWKGTNRITCGLGYMTGGFTVDLAYQYSTTSGDFHPFQPYNNGESQTITVADVSNKRHQLLFTLSYKF